MDTITLSFIINLNIDKLNNTKIWKVMKTKDKTIKYYCKYGNIIFHYYPTRYRLTLTTSITKFLYKSNWVTLNERDLSFFIKELDFLIRFTTKHKLPSVTEFNITRLDLANNYYCRTENDKKVYLDLLRNLSYKHCKTTVQYETSVHKHNKSITYNFYDKHAQDPASPKNLLRLEFQLKNKGINYLMKKGLLKSKKFIDILYNLDSIKKIYAYKLCSLSLNKKIVNKKTMDKLLKNLYIKENISSTIYNNMYKYFISCEYKTVSHNTLTKYKNILSKNNYNHLLLSNNISQSIDFLNFNLFNTKSYTYKINYKVLSLFIFINLNLFNNLGYSLVDIIILLCILYFLFFKKYKFDVG